MLGPASFGHSSSFRFQRKDVPTLAVRGKEDPYIATKYAKRYADALGGATVNVLSGAGRWPWIDNAVMCSGVVSFLR